MAKWKPNFVRTNGKPGATAPHRKVARKLLENMKHRNEELGNYANPVQRFTFNEVHYVLSSLPGYDIIDITVPSVEGEEEVGGKAEIYSGLWEPRFNVHGVGHYLRWYPSDYELYNSDSATPAGLGASVDGAEENLLPAFMPPNRWMYNDYTVGAREEAPWFKDTGQIVSAGAVHPGKYSGKLRELVQMQLGYGLLPQFSYSASNSNGIYLETLDEDTTRIWLYQISATNGVVMQVMSDYSVENFEKDNDLKTGAIPPEIEEAGWFDIQTSFDSTKVVYTKAEWDAIPEDERPGITTVTFRLLEAATFLAAVGSYGAYGNYGWSFNPAGTSAVIVGIDWNSPGGGGLAVNYKSSLFTVTLNPTAFTASISGTGDNPFLMTSANDHVKFPNPDGTLESTYFWKGENGFQGTQPSPSYTAPIYAYYNLNGALETVSYTYTAGNSETQNSGSGQVLNWTETLACREATTRSPTNYHYKGCSGGQSGTGIMGQKHGFTSSITTPDSFDIFDGYRALWASTKSLGGGDFAPSLFLTILYGAATTRPAAMTMDAHYVELEHGDWGAASSSVLIIPSFERLAYYHYQKLQTTLSNGDRSVSAQWVYERGTPVRQWGDGSIGSDDCEFTSCNIPGSNGRIGNRHPASDSAAEYYVSRIASGDVMHPPHLGCSPNDANDCFVEDGVADSNDAPAAQDPYTKDDTIYTGGLVLPNGASIMYSDSEIVTDSKPFRESSGSFGYQSVISCFDTFSSKYIFTMPNVALTATKHTATGFPDDITKAGVLFSGMPYFIG